MIPTLRQLFGLAPWRPANDETDTEARDHLAWWGHLGLLDARRVAEECRQLGQRRRAG